MRKTALCALLVAAGAVALSGCGKNGQSSNAAAGSGAAQAPAASGAAAPASGAQASSASAPSPQQQAAAPQPPAQPLTPLRPNGSMLTTPDGQSMMFLYYSISGRPAPLKDWATNDAANITSNEFDKARKAADLLTSYQKKLAGFASVGKIRFNVNASLGEYDGTNGEYPVPDLSPDRYLSFNYQSEWVEVFFVNGAAASHWKIDATDAEAAFHKNGNSHSVSLILNTTIVGDAVDGGTDIIKARIDDYKIVDSVSGATLGTVTLHS